MQKGYIEPTEKLRRFYASVTSAPAPAPDGGFSVLLDGKSLRTPKGAPLVVPTQGLADLIVAEWAAQIEVIELSRMHATRLANTAAEAVPAAREATADTVASYAASDLLCYFAQEPAGLAERQHRHWSPWLERAEQELGLVFVRAAGIVHREQPAQSIARVKAMALEMDDFTLAGVAFGVSLFGSAILSLALHRGWLTGDQAYELSRLDESWQEEQWGVDAEAAERTARLRGEAEMLERWFKALLPAA